VFHVMHDQQEEDRINRITSDSKPSVPPVLHDLHLHPLQVHHLAPLHCTTEE
jgi:hypothetical protein